MKTADIMKFNSNKYKPVSWSKLLLDSLTANQSEYPLILANNQWAIVPMVYLKQMDKHILVTATTTELVSSKPFKCVSNTYLEERGLSTIKFTSKMPNIEIKNKDYVLLCKQLLLNVLKTMEDIVTYTYQHLLGREAEGVPLTRHEIIQFSFAEVVSLCNLVKVALDGQIDTFAELDNICSYILAGLHGLARLGGGRAILSGNVVELMFHLKLFQSTYLKH